MKRNRAALMCAAAGLALALPAMAMAQSSPPSPMNLAGTQQLATPTPDTIVAVQPPGSDLGNIRIDALQSYLSQGLQQQNTFVVSSRQSNGLKVGNDSNPCNVLLPCGTLDHALAIAPSGATIYVNGNETPGGSDYLITTPGLTIAAWAPNAASITPSAGASKVFEFAQTGAAPTTLSGLTINTQGTSATPIYFDATGMQSLVLNGTTLAAGTGDTVTSAANASFNLSVVGGAQTGTGLGMQFASMTAGAIAVGGGFTSAINSLQTGNQTFDLYVDENGVGATPGSVSVNINFAANSTAPANSGSATVHDVYVRNANMVTAGGSYMLNSQPGDTNTSCRAVVQDTDTSDPIPATVASHSPNQVGNNCGGGGHGGVTIGYDGYAVAAAGLWAQSGNTLTTPSYNTGSALFVGETISGGPAWSGAQETITAIGASPNTYTTSASETLLAGFTITGYESGSTLTVVSTTGTLAVGQNVSAAGGSLGAVITASAGGGAGNYTTNAPTSQTIGSAGSPVTLYVNALYAGTPNMISNISTGAGINYVIGPNVGSATVEGGPFIGDETGWVITDPVVIGAYCGICTKDDTNGKIVDPVLIDNQRDIDDKGSVNTQVIKPTLVDATLTAASYAIYEEQDLSDPQIGYPYSSNLTWSGGNFAATVPNNNFRFYGIYNSCVIGPCRSTSGTNTVILGGGDNYFNVNAGNAPLSGYDMVFDTSPSASTTYPTVAAWAAAHEASAVSLDPQLKNVVNLNATRSNLDAIPLSTSLAISGSTAPPAGTLDCNGRPFAPSPSYGACQWQGGSTTAQVFAVVGGSTGAGPVVEATSPTILTPTISGNPKVTGAYIDASGVRVALTSAYTIPAGTDLVRFTQSSTVSASTVTLPTGASDGQAIQIVNYAGAVTALTFSPAVNGWTQAGTLAPSSGLRIRYDATAAAWYREQ